MGIENLIGTLTVELVDIKEHNADYCYIKVEDVEETIEYLEQLKILRDNN